ncbi:conserved Plasmodium protein, unknown function [Plasmodium chabaudi chabaudi]|uniref:Uncharacterized protein n=1 Tax=Plasmodium chabaudi chabaudi TaxID=31271 RepID=A0A4V0K6V6_PLACU|nr:conserved Plasmodium protein, unknown function [Plasmodium chabaudi chabaudi]VTZ68172.1 conserved Plasmodium protein, unknown function [Plasmodium chabaudi chabaudi]|eukprot:XP_738473.2 conserved Plasmodium protein, unknown function [Plasmodium chabaudi chabaudi]
MNSPWKLSAARRFIRLFSSKLEVPYFFKNDSGVLIKEQKILPCEISKKENEKESGYTLINNIHYMKEFDFYERLIKIYVDVLFNYPKYPLHVQHLHIFGRNLLKEKVDNVKQSREHKNVILGTEDDNTNDLNEYLAELNNTLFYNNSSREKKIYTNCQIDNIISRVKEFYNCKNVIYALFNLEHNKIIFNYTENLLLKDLQHCFVNSNINNNRKIYKYINKNGKDNVYIYILEFSKNLNILKNRFELIKKLFYPYSTSKNNMIYNKHV